MKPFIQKLIRGISIIVGIVILPAAILYLGMNDAPATTRVTASDLHFDGIHLSSPNGFSYNLVGSLENNSRRHEVSRVVVRVTFKDCPPAGDCETVLEEDVWISGSIPPRGKWNFKVPISTPDLKSMRDRMQWTYSVVRIEAN